MSSVLVGDDGLARCAWAGGDAEYQRYHDEEWGTPLHGDRELFEKLSLEGFQAGLSWITILRRRPTFRAAFRDFHIDVVAAFDARDVERLMADPGIIRNRLKVDATISNARVAQALVHEHPGALDELIWSFAPAPRDHAPVVVSRAAGGDTGVRGPERCAQEARLPLRRADDRLCPHAVGRPGR